MFDFQEPINLFIKYNLLWFKLQAGDKHKLPSFNVAITVGSLKLST